MAIKPQHRDVLGRHLSDTDRVTVLAYLDRIMEERDRLYAIQFKAAETAVNAALAAQEKQTTASFLASEKAIVKAEEAQRDYNVRSNEFRGQLDDQAKTLMPRPECLGIFKSMGDKIDGVRMDFERRLDVQSKEIGELRESRSEVSGRSAGGHAVKDESRANIAIIVAFMSLLFVIGTAVFALRP